MLVIMFFVGLFVLGAIAAWTKGPTTPNAG
jgi:hypothetical protein